MSAEARIAEAVAARDYGQPSAVKRGRRPEWPYVPVILKDDGTGWVKSHQILGRAFATRDEAVADAERHIAEARERDAAALAKRNMRALREHFGLPRELADLLSSDG